LPILIRKSAPDGLLKHCRTIPSFCFIKKYKFLLANSLSILQNTLVGSLTKEATAFGPNGLYMGTSK